MNQQRIATKIKNIREYRNYTQSHMAGQLGIKQNAHSLWERGDGLTAERVEQIARVLDVPPEELLSPDPVSLTLTNNHGNTGYVSIQNQQQHTMPLDIVDRLLKENQQRASMLAELLKSQLELLKSALGKKG